MAEQRVVLDFFVNGTSRIDKLVNQVTQLQGVVDSLNQVPLEINVKKATSQFERLDSELKLLESTLKGQKASFSAANKSINDQQKAIDKSGTSIEKYQDQLVSIQRQLQSLNPGTKKYNDLLDRQNKIIKDYASAQSDLAEAQDKLLESQKNKSIIGERLEKAKTKVESGRKLQSEAKKLKDLTEALDGLATQYLELGIAQKNAKETTPLASGLDIRAARPRTQENPSIAQLNSQASALDLIAKNSSIASSQFNRFTIATEVASQRIYEAGQQKLKALAFGLSKQAKSVNIGVGGPKTIAAARDTIDSLIGSYGGVVKSEAALSSYISRLQSLQSLVPYLSEEYNKLERAIGDVSAEMESLQKMTQLRGAVSKIQPQAGPASLLPSESVKSADEKAKYYEKINKYQDRLVGVEERISQANLNTLQQTELRARVDKALGLLAENRLDDAKKETIEIERQRMSLERMNRAQKPLTFGALGTGFSPITGELPSGATISGSPAAKIAEAKANRESTQAAVALAQQKQKAIEQEAEELRKGTQAATALGKQKLKALEDQANLLREETRNAVALAQQKMREEEKAIADAWKMRGGPELPPGFTEAGRIQQRGGVYRTGKFSPVDGKKRLENIIGSGAILEQSLINLERKGVDVATEREKLQKALNAAKEDGFEISLKTLDVLDGQLTSARNFIRLQNTIRAGEAKSNKAAGSGLEAALKSLQEARGAGETFLGGASPAEAIDKIVREFNTGKTVIGNAGQNAASTFVDNIKGAAGSAASAGKTFASSAAKAILKVFGIASPSRFMIELVKNLADTYVSQMEKEYPRIKAATAKAFGEQTLLRDVKKLRATNKGFEEYGRPSTGFKPFPLGAGTAGATSEFNDLINSFRRQIAELTTQPGIYGNLLNALPNSRITTDLAAAANRRAAASEIPSFMSTQRMLGPGELERFITAKFAEYLKDIKIPNPWVGAIGDYKEFIAKVVGETNKLRVPSFSGTRALPQGQIAGLLPAAEDSISNKFEDRIRQAFERSAQRGAAVFAEDATRRFGAGVAAIGSGVIPPNVPPSVPPGSGGGAGAGGGGAAQEGQRLLTLADAQINQASINELEGLAQGLNQFRNALNPAIEGFDLLDNQLRETINNINDVLESRAPGADPLTRRFPGRRGRAISEGLVGGAFPLLFGQGVGASVGGGLGGAAGALVGGNLGFGLALAGTAIGAEIDKAVIAAGELNSAFLTAAGSYSEIRKQGIQFTAELENQVNLLKESGNFAGATQLERGAVQGATGDINAAATQGVAAAGNVLAATWNDTYKAIQTTLGIIASPFLFALNALLTPVKALFQGFNAIASGVAYIIRLIPGVAGSIDSSNEKAYKLTKEYQDQIAEINKQINEANKLNNIQAEQVSYARQSLGLGRADTEILGRRAEAAKRVAENEKEIEKIRRENPTRTEEQRQKVNQLVSQQQRKFILEESAIAFTKAQEIFLEIQDNNRQIAQQKKEYEQQYQDFVIDRVREQADLNLEAVRKVQDARLKGLEQEAKAAKEIADERLRAEELASKQRSLTGSVQAAVSGDPVTGELLNNVQTAIEQWRNGRQAVENETASRQKQLQLEIQRGEVQIQRYKYDMAIKIARANEDSQKKIARINEQINKQNEEVSRRANLRKLVELTYETQLQVKQAERDREQAKQALASKFNITPVQKEFYANQLQNAQSVIDALNPVFKELEKKLAKAIDVPELPKMQNIPALTAPSADVAKAEASVLKQLQTTEEYITALKQTNGLNQENITLAETIISLNRQGLDQVNQLAVSAKTELATKQESFKLLVNGVNPAIADQIAQLQVAASLEEGRLRRVIDLLKAYKDPALKAALAPLIEDLQTILDAIPQKVSTARTTIEKSAQPIAGEKIASAYAQAKQELEDLATWENVAVTGAQAIGDAFGNAFKEIAAGTASAKEILAGFFQGIADSFADMAAKMISNLIMLSLYKNIFGPLFGLDLGSAIPAPAANGAAFSNGIKPFAMGGVVSSPTLFKFADGGAMNTGVMGEAGPEAIMPLSRGSDGKLGVTASGSGGSTNNVTVNVDATGSKVQGDNNGANQLGRAVAAAVQEELLRQKRPGGLLS